MLSVEANPSVSLPSTLCSCTSRYFSILIIVAWLLFKWPCVHFSPIQSYAVSSNNFAGNLRGSNTVIIKLAVDFSLGLVWTTCRVGSWKDVESRKKGEKQKILGKPKHQNSNMTATQYRTGFDVLVTLTVICLATQSILFKGIFLELYFKILREFVEIVLFPVTTFIV